MIETTQEQKIDYIYARLKKQEKTEKIGVFLKWGFRVFIIGYLYYFLTMGLPAMISGLMPKMPDFGSQSSDTGINTEQIQNLIGEYFSN